MVTTTTGLATSYINFSRASLATVTNNVGNIAWAGHNLLTNSESFDSSSWVKNNTTSATPTVTANTAAAPNGTTTADTVAFGAIDAAGDGSFLAQVFTAVEATYRGGVYIKAAAAGDVGKKVWMFMYDSAYRGVASVTLTTEWQLLSATATLTAGANREFYIATLGSTNGGENQGAVTVHLWGAHLYRSDLGGMVFNPAMPAGMGTYYPTTPRNLLGYTEDFSNAYWSKDNILAFGSGSISNAVIAPNGLQTADLLVPDTTSNLHVVRRELTTSSPRTISIYAKAGGYNYLLIAANGNTGNQWVSGSFNLISGTSTIYLGSGAGTAAATSAIVSVGNGWFRCSITITVNGNIDTVNGYQPRYIISNTGVPDNAAFGGQVFTGDGTSGVYLWGAQLSDSASIDPYTPVYGAAVTSAAYYAPRLDYSPTSLQPLGLLVEEQRTNLLLRSQEFDSATWSKPSVTVTANDAASPDGTNSGDKVLQGASGGYLFQGVTGAVSTTYTFSVFAKPDVAQRTQVYVGGGGVGGSDGGVRFNAVTGEFITYVGTAPTSYSRTVLANGWIRFSVTFTTSGSDNTFDCSLSFLDGSNSAINQSGWFYGAQVEAGSFATSYIPTSASQVTRSKDVASLSVQAFPYSQSDGSVVVSFDSVVVTSGADNAIMAISDGTGSNRIENYSSSQYHLYIVANSSLQANIDAGTISVNTVTKIGSAFAANNFAAVINGGTVGTDTSGIMPTVNTMYFGADASGAYQLNGHVRQITYIPRRLTNADLQTRTT